MRSLPAIYEGQEFRSRLEARWACFWSVLNIPWSYEPAVVDLGGMTYIPDFYLPSWRCWVEIKGEMVSDQEGLRIIEKCARLNVQDKKTVILCFDQPYDPRCAVFHNGKMYSDARWALCRYCGALGMGFVDKATGAIAIRCPDSRAHGPIGLDVAAFKERRTVLYEAAISARQARFAWPKRKKAS